MFLVLQRSASCVLLVLRLFRFGFDFVFGFKFSCSGGSLDYLVSAAALILFDQESPSPLTLSLIHI